MVLVIYKIQVRGDTVDSAVKRNRYEIDMCNGTVLDKLISFSKKFWKVSWKYWLKPYVANES